MDNLIQLLGEQMTPSVMKSLGGMLGSDGATTQKGVDAAIPSILGMLMKQGSSKNGAQQMIDMVSNQPAGLDFSDLAGILGNNNSQSALMNLGGSMLPSLLGSRANNVENLIGSSAGLSGGAGKSLLKMLAPFAMNFIMRRLRNGGGLNVESLMGLLGGQRGFVEKAAPKGLLDSLGMNSWDDLDRSSKVHHEAPARQTTQRERSYTEPVQQQSSGIGRFLIPLLGLLALGLLGWWAMNNLGGGANAVPAAVCTNLTSIDSSISGMPAINENTSVSTLTGMLGTVGAGLNKITDAKSDLAGLDTVTTAFNTLESTVNGISGSELGSSAGAVSTAMDNFSKAGSGLSDRYDCN